MASFARNSAFHFLGGLLPAIASLLTVPVIVGRLGESHYGLFALVTAIVGYFAILDINVTAGSVKFIAEFDARGKRREVSQVVTFGGLIYGLIGLIGGGSLFIFAPELAHGVFNIPEALQSTAVASIHVAAVGFLLSQIQVYLQSIPQALQRYDVSGTLESVFGSLVPFSTLVVVLSGGDLVDIMVTRAALSALNIAVLIQRLTKLLPDFRVEWPERDVARAVTAFSAYAFLSRFASTTYVNADKLLLGALTDLRAVSFYSVPFMLVNRVFGLILRVGQVLFPMSSALAAGGDIATLRNTYLIVTRYVIFLNSCIALGLSVFSRELLHYWAGDVFGAQAALVLVIIASAVFVDSLTNIPSLVNDGLGRPRNTGVFAVARAFIGILGAWIGIRVGGIVGAAWSQLIVSSVMSFAFLVFVHRRTLPVSLGEVWQQSWRVSIFPVLTLVPFCVLTIERAVLPLPLFLSLVILTVCVSAAYGFFVVCDVAHRVLLLGAVRARFGSGASGR